MGSKASDEHVIFKVCLSCGFDTLQFPNRPRHRGPSCKCPECELYTFVIACSKCLLESSIDCPLTRLLNHKHSVHIEEAKEEERPRGRPRKVSWERRSREDIQKMLPKTPAKTQAKEENVKPSRTSQSLVVESMKEQKKQGRDLCLHCRQRQCQECNPGYMSLIVDMKEFSRTMAEEMRFCTMCEHQLCPGSELVVLLKCMDCGHEGCEKCALKNDGGEEWSKCCMCRDESQKSGW